MNNIKNDRYYIERILVDSKFIVEHMKDVEIKQLEDNELLLDSMSFRLIQIQENSKKLTDEYKLKHKTIPWIDIAGLRNRIVHDYGNVDLSVIYNTLKNDIPYLISELTKINK